MTYLPFALIAYKTSLGVLNDLHSYVSAQFTSKQLTQASMCLYLSPCFQPDAAPNIYWDPERIKTKCHGLTSKSQVLDEQLTTRGVPARCPRTPPDSCTAPLRAHQNRIVLALVSLCYNKPCPRRHGLYGLRWVAD